MLTFDEFLNKAVKVKPFLDVERVTEAFNYVDKINYGRVRLSGDPYILHVLHVIDILLSLNADEDTLIAGMLHGCMKTGKTTKEEIGSMFGENVLFLVESVDRLKYLKSTDESVELESIRAMFITMAKDLRVILIKLADRLHNMQTIEFKSIVKQKHMARETLDIYVPISSRLGIYSLKSKLEDLSFKTLYPKQYDLVRDDLDEFLQGKEKLIEHMKNKLNSYLISHNIEANIYGRIKNLYSIYRKLKYKSQTTLNDLHDVLAMRVVLPDKIDENGVEVYDHLYSVLGLIHNKWAPVTYRFKDYVALPKPNGYQSLHTVVLGLSLNDTHVTEIQLRTERMHLEAEYGVASHWIYDDNKKIEKNNMRNIYSVEELSKSNFSAKRYAEWIDSVSNINYKLQHNSSGIEALKIDIFSDRIFVMTPRGDVKDLPQGSTPVDFAFSVHTDIGNKCYLSKVNGSIVPLSYELQNGDVVDIVTSNNSHPKTAWLSFVKTANAKSKIRSFLRSLDKEKSFKDGKDILNKYLMKIGKPLLDDDLSILRIYDGEKLSMRGRISLVEDIGVGFKMPNNVVRSVFGVDFSNKNRVARPINKFLLPKKNNINIDDEEIYIDGEKGLPFKFAKCCNPQKGLPIIGYVTSDHSVTIHLKQCKHLNKLSKEKLLDASWGDDLETTKFPVKLNLFYNESVGLIREVVEVLSDMNINVISFSDVVEKEKSLFREVVLEIVDYDQLKNIVGRLNKINNVVSVKESV